MPACESATVYSDSLGNISRVHLKSHVLGLRVVAVTTLGEGESLNRTLAHTSRSSGKQKQYLTRTNLM